MECTWPELRRRNVAALLSGTDEGGLCRGPLRPVLSCRRAPREGVVSLRMPPAAARLDGLARLPSWQVRQEAPSCLRRVAYSADNGLLSVTAKTHCVAASRT